MRVSNARRSHILAAAFIVGTLAIPALTIPAEAQIHQWTFRVIADPAVVRAGPDPIAPVVDSFAKGEQVKSFAAEGAWIRFLIARRDGSVVIGYVAATDLALLETKEEAAADYWKVDSEAYNGPGFVIRLSGGYGMLGGGDVPTGVADRYQAAVDQAEARGYNLVLDEPLGFGSRISGDLDILYHLSPRFALGLGGSYASTRAFADYSYADYYGVTAEPKLRTTGYRLIVSYLLPLSKLLSLRLSGGPMLAQTKFEYSSVTLLPSGEEKFGQTANATGFGAHASLALELNLNEFASIFIEACGRAGRITGFEGSQISEAPGPSGWTETDEQSGTLYAVEAGGRTFLMILSDPALAPGPYHEAAYNLTGVDGRLGFKIRF